MRRIALVALAMAVCATAPADAATWRSTYDWAHGHGYNGFGSVVSSADPAGYGLSPALGGQPGEWIWLTGNRDYRPGSAEWRFTAPGTTRIKSASFDYSYANKLLAHHCVTVGIGETSALRSARTDCNPAADSAAASFGATDPSDSPASKRAVLQVTMPPCNNPSDKACSKNIPSLDPLKNGHVARLKGLDMVLVDDDLPQASASGPLRDLQDRYVDGRSSYAADVAASDAGSGMKRAALERVGAGEAAAWDATCDPTHNTPALGAAICPPSLAGSTTVDANALPEGRMTYRATAADLAGNAGTSADWSFFVDRTPPPAPEGIGADYDEENEGAAVWWTSNADPDLPDGWPGSGATGEIFRYKLTGGDWSPWAPTTLDGFTLGEGVAPGSHLWVEARTTDAVGNLSPVASADFDMSPPAECSPEDCPDGDDLEEDSFVAQCDGSASAPDWCAYVKGVYDWADELAAAAEGPAQGKALAKGGVQAAVAKLADSPPLPPEDFKSPAACAQDALSAKRCFDAVDAWQAQITSWLADHGLTGQRAANLRPLPVFDDARSDLARDLTRASAGAFGVVADTRENRGSDAEVRISFDSPVGSGYLGKLLDDMHANGADALRGTFFGRTTTITAGYSAGDSDLRTQLRTFYGQQLDGIDSIDEGLRADLDADQNDTQRRATRAEIANVGDYRDALAGRDPVVSAIVVRGNEQDVLDAMTAAGSPVQSVAPVSSREEPDPAGAPQPARAIAAEQDAPGPGKGTPAPRAKATVHAAGLSPRNYMPNRWNVRTMAERSTDSPYVKNSYAGFRWTQSKTLDWYQHDDHHDRGFEAQVHPYKGGGLWSTNWYKTHWYGDDVTRGPCPDTHPNCSAVWNSNMPDAYRDDLSSDGDYKSFAVGSADAKSLRYGTAYFAWYLTNKGDTAGGRAVAEGQATRRATNVQEEGYCKSHFNHDSACFFAEATKQIATYPLEARYHKYIRSW